MTIKFINPNSNKRDYLEELEKIVSELQKKPDPVLQKNKRFVREFVRSMFHVSKKKQKQRLRFQQVQLPTQPLYPSPRRIKPKPTQQLPPPPPPPSASPQSQFRKENNTLIQKKPEPEMSDKDMELYKKVAPKIQKNPEKQDEIIKKAAKNLNLEISQPYTDKIKYYLERDLKKYNILTPLVEEPRVSAININSFDNINAIFDDEELPTNMKFDSKKDLLKFQKFLANKYNQKIKKESQIDIQTPDTRITGIYSNHSPNLKIEKL